MDAVTDETLALIRALETERDLWRTIAIDYEGALQRIAATWRPESAPGPFNLDRDGCERLAAQMLSQHMVGRVDLVG